MKNYILIAVIIALCSCVKETIASECCEPYKETATINFSFSVDNVGTRAFFDNNLGGEHFENEINNMTILLLPEKGECAAYQQISADELNNGVFSFTFREDMVPAGGYHIYIAANVVIQNPENCRWTTRSTISYDWLPESQQEFNSTLDGSAFPYGLPMVANSYFELKKGKKQYDMEITLKRAVNKLAFKTQITPEFYERNGGTARITQIGTTPLSIKPCLFAYGGNVQRTAVFSQNSELIADKYCNLLYLQSHINTEDDPFFITINGFWDEFNDGREVPFQMYLPLNGVPMFQNNYNRISIEIKDFQEAVVKFPNTPNVWDLTDWGITVG